MRKLKIIQILPTLNTGGVERGVLDFNKYLVNKGHDSYVISNGVRQVKNLIEDGGNHIHLQVSKKSIFTLLQAKKLADIISMPNGTLDILCDNVFIPEKKDDNMRRLYNFMEALEKGNMSKEELNKFKF